MMLYNETNMFINNYHLLLGIVGHAFVTFIVLTIVSNKRSMQLIESIAFKDESTHGLNNSGCLKEVSNRLKKSTDYCLVFSNVKRFRSICNMEFERGMIGLYTSTNLLPSIRLLMNWLTRVIMIIIIG